MSYSHTSTDEQLWQSAVAGSADARRAPFLRHQQAVYTHCFRRTASHGAAEDLTSAVFLEAWKPRSQVQLYGHGEPPRAAVARGSVGRAAVTAS
jgi:DNA-directed RNA polymerase specialized sigma24 family protein